MKNEHALNQGTLLVLDVASSSILAFKTDGTPVKTILAGLGGTPDGIAIDAVNHHIYWTNMGEHWDQNNGFIERVDFNGSNRSTIIPTGSTFTPKQLQLDLENRYIYWCDREGMKVMRAGMDGSDISTLIISGDGSEDRQDEMKHCVGVAIDSKREHLYWTQKGSPKSGTGRIFRAGLALPDGADPANRPDVEIVFDHLPEPIDLDIPRETDQLFWTDRGAPPEGNTLNRTSIKEGDPLQPQILTVGLKEAIGLAIDVANNRAFVVDLGGNIYCSHLDGTGHHKIFKGSEKHMFTGIAYIPEDV